LPYVFLSHSHKDRDVAKRLAQDLTKEGIEVWLDEWEILVGDSIAQRVQQGLSQVDFVTLLLTEDSVASGWVEKEWQSQIGLEAERKQIRVLPVRGDTCEIPALLRDRRYADLNPDYQSGLYDLVRAIHGRSSRETQELKSPPPEPLPYQIKNRTPLRLRRYVYAGAVVLLAVASVLIYRFQNRAPKLPYELTKGQLPASFARSSHIVTPAESYKIREVLQLPTLEYSRFELLEDRRVIDLRDWKPFEKDAGGRLSPVTWSRRVRLQKVAEAEWVRFAFATEGSGIDAECSSGQDYYLETGMIASTPPQLLMREFQVAVNVGRYRVGEEFEIELAATFWNGSSAQEDWTAYKVYAPVKICSILILYPEWKRFQWKKIVMYEPGSRDEHAPPENQQGVIYTPDQRALYWEIIDPKPDKTYEIQWGW
jgi:TIR domain